MATYDYIDATGVIVPDTSTLQTDVTGEWQTAFGVDIALTPDTPQGVEVVAEVIARSDVLANNALVANQINPNLASGVFLDALCALMGVTRAQNTYTTVPNVTLTASAQSVATVIPAGSLAQTAAGDIFYSNASVTIPPTGGTATVGFTAQQPGPVPCAANTLSMQLTQILGWTAINNTEAADFTGALIQSDDSLRTARNNMIYLYGKSSPEAQLSSMYDVPGVLGAQFLENYTNAAATISGITLAAHSIWMCVDGGSPANIGWSLLSNKTDGAGYNGAQSVTVIDPSSMQPYTVNYDIPTDVPLLATVTVSQGTFVGDATLAVNNAVVAYSLGQVNLISNTGESTTLPGFALAAEASPFQISAGVMAECPGLIVTNVQIGLVSGGGIHPTSIAMAINQKASIQSSAVSVVIV